MRMIYISEEQVQAEFARKAAEYFAKHPKCFTYTHGEIAPGVFFAIRFGIGDDCVVVIKVDDNHEPVNYQNLIREYSVGGDQGIDEKICRPLTDVFVVVTDRDHPVPIKSRGPICMETYTGESDLVKAVDRAKVIGKKYGGVTICKLVPVGDLEFCEKIINTPI